MKKRDRATKFTLDYLGIIERCLDFRRDQDDELFLVTPIKAPTLKQLKNEISELFRDNSLDNAISDSRAYGQENVQTVGFGLIQHTDFDKFIKMGFLCGTRLVLWDLLGTRILRTVDDSPEQIASVAITASNLLLLRSVAEDGGLVILPHPPVWSIEARNQLAQIVKTNDTDTAHYGLILALSVLEEVPLHPYTLFPGRSMDWPKQPTMAKGTDYYTKEVYAFHKIIDDTFEDKRFAYMKDVKAADFYKIVSQDMSVQQELQKMLTLPVGNLSPQQVAAHSKTARDSLATLIERRNKQLITEDLGKIGSTLAFVTAFGTTIHSAAFAATNPIGIAIMGLSASLFALLSRVYKKEKQNTIVQAFMEISETAKYKNGVKYS